MISRSVFFIVCFTTILLSQQQRQRLSFDAEWKFCLGDIKGADVTDFDDSGWRTLDLPHDWSIEGTFDKDAPVAGNGAYLPTGIGWYRKHFTLPATAKDKQVIIEFDGVYMYSDVWINGNHLGRRPFGYISFQYDLTPYLREGENVIAVRVDNSLQPNTRWYSGSGIYRHVWLDIMNDLHIRQWGVFVSTPYAKSDSATVRIITSIENKTNKAAGNFILENVIVNAGGEEVTSETTEIVLEGRAKEAEQIISLKNPALWSLEAPSMYTMHTMIKKDGRIIDDVLTPFGIRETEYSTAQGFLLNGLRVKMKGVNLHHDGGVVGAAVPEGVWERRLKILKTMGCNAIRTAHNPPAREFLDLCDRLGFLVMDEVFDEWKYGKREYAYNKYFDAWAEKDLTEFIRRDRNHPSVVMWSLGNEIPEQAAEDGHLLLQKLADIARREDPTRLSTVGCNEIVSDNNPAQPQFLHSLDIVGYNYVDRWHERRELFFSIDKIANPGWLMVGSENVSNGGVRGGYSLGDDPELVRPDYNYRMIRAEQLWKFVATRDYVIGDFMWTGIDYLGEARWPRKNNFAGVIDLCGFKKDGFYFYQSQWTEEPMLHIFPHWNWAGREDQVIPVLCYTNMDTVELFLNGKSFGEKRIEFPRQGNAVSWNGYERPRVLPTTADLHLSWDVPYEPGVIKMVAKRAGGIVLTDSVVSTGHPHKIVLEADKSSLRAGSRDVVHFTVKIVDKNGFMVPEADNRIRIKVDGPGRIIGVGNGNAADLESFQSTNRKAFNGMLLAIVQVTGEQGKITCRMESDRLQAAEITVNAD